MPTHTRGTNVDEGEPDTVVPRAIFPDTDGGYELQSAVVMLNLGEYDSDKHYAAMVLIRNLNTYVLFFRPVGGIWTIGNMRVLTPDKNDSLSMLDEDIHLRKTVYNVIGITPKTGRRRNIRRKTTKHSNKKRYRNTKKRAHRSP